MQRGIRSGRSQFCANRKSNEFFLKLGLRLAKLVQITFPQSQTLLGRERNDVAFYCGAVQMATILLTFNIMLSHSFTVSTCGSHSQGRTQTILESQDAATNRLI